MAPSAVGVKTVWLEAVPSSGQTSRRAPLQQRDQGANRHADDFDFRSL